MSRTENEEYFLATIFFHDEKNKDELSMREVWAKGKAKTPYASHSSIHLVFLLFLYSGILPTDPPSPCNLEDSAAPHQPTLCMGYHNISIL
ncbi:hypothetical protein EYC80_008955 [Monilinia laxa]|uniref:Uncharacterized protein n=1 Tax=Monilinia laxa TaxID=61186 RepID=A0A5N6K1Z2_MONLA|nr:hypothetical protein EYC80_008955 [Monilinia laxa]